MSLKSKLSLAALCVAAIASGSASAAEIGKGTIAINGSIGTATCTVVPSKTAVTMPTLVPANIKAAALSSELTKQSLNLDFNDCGVIGDTLNVAVMRDVSPPTGTAAEKYSAGFTYTGGAATASETGPVFYKVSAANQLLPLTPTNPPVINLDVSTITDKSKFSIPMDITIHKAPDSAVNPAQYTGNYAANMAWTVTYP